MQYYLLPRNWGPTPSVIWRANAFILFAIAWAVSGISVRAGSITYNIVPMNLIFGSSDYSVSGSITTNGAVGALKRSDVISWLIAVDGPRPYVFHSGNPGATFSPLSVTATRTELSLRGGQFYWLVISAHDNTIPDCTDCEQRLRWDAWFEGALTYNHYDRADSSPPFAPAVGFQNTFGATIATRVPEPSGLLFMAFFSMFLLPKRTWKGKRGRTMSARKLS